MNFLKTRNTVKVDENNFEKLWDTVDNPRLKKIHGKVVHRFHLKVVENWGRFTGFGEKAEDLKVI